MRTLVTGGAGFIGSHLVDRLLADGGEVTVIDNFDPFYDESRKRANLAGASRHARFRLVEMDIRDAEGVGRVVREARPEAVVHLAARAGVRPSIADPALYAEVNVVGTVHLLEACSRLRGPPPVRLRLQLQRLRRPADGTVPRDRPGRPAGQPLCRHEEGLRAAGAHVPPPARPPRDRAPLLHRVRAEEPARPGDRQVRRPDRGRAPRPDVRRRDHPARLHLRRRHRRRHRPRGGSLHGPSPVQPRQLEPDRAAGHDPA